MGPMLGLAVLRRRQQLAQTGVLRPHCTAALGHGVRGGWLWGCSGVPLGALWEGQGSFPSCCGSPRGSVVGGACLGLGSWEWRLRGHRRVAVVLQESPGDKAAGHAHRGLGHKAATQWGVAMALVQGAPHSGWPVFGVRDGTWCWHCVTLSGPPSCHPSRGCGAWFQVFFWGGGSVLAGVRVGAPYGAPQGPGRHGQRQSPALPPMQDCRNHPGQALPYPHPCLSHQRCRDVHPASLPRRGLLRMIL